MGKSFVAGVIGSVRFQGNPVARLEGDMSNLARRSLLALALVWCAAPAAVMAEDKALAPPPEPAEWQGTITTQIEAFRTHDSVTALSMAAKAFRTSFPDAESFYLTIVHSGYAAIALSRSHQFGAFRVVDADTVLQEVKLIDEDQGLYSAQYMLGREPEGWRVEAVQLKDEQAIGI
jgi:hypothetical protein